MAGSTANGSGPGQGPAPKKTYAVDVRVFLVGVTAAMALSFGLGVALGPSTAAEVSARIASPAGTGDALKQSQPRRLPTAHSVEIGERVRRDLNELHVNYETPSLEDLGGGEDVASLEDRGAGRNASVAVPAADLEALPVAVAEREHDAQQLGLYVGVVNVKVSTQSVPQDCDARDVLAEEGGPGLHAGRDHGLFHRVGSEVLERGAGLIHVGRVEHAHARE